MWRGRVVKLCSGAYEVFMADPVAAQKSGDQRQTLDMPGPLTGCPAMPALASEAVDAPAYLGPATELPPLESDEECRASLLSIRCAIQQRGQFARSRVARGCHDGVGIGQ